MFFAAIIAWQKAGRKAAYWVSKVSATSASSCRMGRCWGQMFSHFPQWRQSEALPPWTV